MERRDFLKSTLASTGALMFGVNWRCTESGRLRRIFPKSDMPAKLQYIRPGPQRSYHEKVFLTCFQGLLNRKKADSYIIHSEVDEFWLKYYAEAFQIENEFLNDPFQLVQRHVREVAGFIVYDPEMPHSLNIATTLGALQNAVPVSKTLKTKMKSLGLKQVDDLTNRWENGYQAYEWAAAELLPQCHPQLLAELCVHHPGWPTSSYKNRDYVIAHKIFSVDLSSSERDKRDYQLLREIYAAYPEETVILGWHCVRDKEHEAIALSAEFGHYGMCSLRTPNLTVHSSIRLPENKTFKQRPLKRKSLKVEDKVYIAFMATDGDAAWFMLDLIKKDWANPAHGSFKYNWGFLPMAYDLLPGTVQYYLENMTENDYFVAGPAGATYTYPHLHPHPEKFLRLSQDLMNKCGLTTVHITNWNDRNWWQEVDLPAFPKSLRENMPDCVGFVRGMGESAFEKNYLTHSPPYIFCGEGLHYQNDYHAVLKDFIDASPNRPLFIYCLVNHNIPMDQVKEAVEKISAAKIEVVHLDELLALVEKAHAEGKLKTGLYPEKEGYRRILANEARQAWPGFHAELKTFQHHFQLGEAAFVAEIRKTRVGLEQVVPGDILAFQTIWQGMQLVKLALETKGIYVNHKPTATQDFIREFQHIADAKLINELQTLWNEWHQRSIPFSAARQLAERLVKIADFFNAELE
ncbi:MAG: GxGYxYP domain-containing protein [Methanosarcinaceae archaeon]